MTDLPPAIIRSDGAPLAGSDLTGHDSWTQTCATAAHDRPAPLALDRLPQCPAAFGARGILTHQTTAFVVATPAKHRTSSHRTRVAPSISRSCPRSRPDALPPLLPPNSRLILPGLITVVRPSYIARPSQLPGPACTCSCTCSGTATRPSSPGCCGSAARPPPGCRVVRRGLSVEDCP